MDKEYKRLKDLWYRLKKEGNLYQADQIKHQMKLWKKTEQKTELKA